MGQNALKVSVVIPVYNEEKYIGACLESLMHQIEPPDEIIVVNNNSTDNSVKIIKEFPVKLVHEKQQGMTPARNRGFNEAQYDIIARTDADTILPKNWVKRIKKSFAADENLVALSGPAEFYDLPELLQNRHLQTKATWIRVIITYNRVVKRLLKHDCLYGPNYAFRKAAWDQIKQSVCLNDKDVHEDLDLSIHLAPLGTVKFYRNLVVSSSARRWKKPEAHLEYLYRGLKSIRRHKPIGTRVQSRLLMKKLVSKTFFLNRL
ncbi:MAG: glycosyltransferase family 2 protein [Candidatus Levyibacteriota bacterium]